MKTIFAFLLPVVLIACNWNEQPDPKNQTMPIEQKDLQNTTMKNYAFLDEMDADDYYPGHLVDKGKTILVHLCYDIEQQKPADLEALYQLTHNATDMFNLLQQEFEENESELETVARDCIAVDFENIAKAYGFENADIEELVATRDW